jgi:hypothetical protein
MMSKMEINKEIAVENEHLANFGKRLKYKLQLLYEEELREKGILQEADEDKI